MARTPTRKASVAPTPTLKALVAPTPTQKASVGRVATLKVLPEGGTSYFAAAPILSLGLTGADGERAAFAYTVAVAVQASCVSFV